MIKDALTGGVPQGGLMWSTELEMIVRAVAVYIVGLFIIRFGKQRLLGRTTAFDMVLAFILGSLFSRAINGSAEVLPTAVAGVTLVFLHWGIANLARHWEWCDTLVKGRHRKLVVNGELRRRDMRGADVSERDLHEALRLRGGIDDTAQVEMASMERNGEISILPRKDGPRVFEVSVEEGVQTVRIELT